MSETATITPQDVARGLFMAAQEEGIDWQQARLPADAIRYEAAAQAALQAWALGSPDWDKGLPPPARELATLFLADFMLKLMRGDLAGRSWTVPAGLSAAQQARLAIAQELATAAGRGAPPH